MHMSVFSKERFFVTTARTQLAKLEALSGCAEMDKYRQCLALIKQAAMPVQAKAVYRAALAVEKILEQKGISDSVALSGRMSALRSLINLYSEGLFELDPEFRRQVENKTKNNTESDTTPNIVADISLAGIDENTIEPANENSANKQAKENLRPLLGLTQTKAQKHSLQFLMEYKPDAEEFSKTQTMSLASAISASENSESFDAIMRSITRSALAEARAYGQDISISYSSEFDDIEQKTASKLQALFLAVCLEIIKSGSKTNHNTRQNRHIVFSGSILSGIKTIKIEWSGEMFSRSQSFNQLVTEFEEIGGNINMGLEHMPSITIICHSGQKNMANQEKSDQHVTNKQEKTDLGLDDSLEINYV